MFLFNSVWAASCTEGRLHKLSQQQGMEMRREAVARPEHLALCPVSCSVASRPAPARPLSSSTRLFHWRSQKPCKTCAGRHPSALPFTRLLSCGTRCPFGLAAEKPVSSLPAPWRGSGGGRYLLRAASFGLLALSLDWQGRGRRVPLVFWNMPLILSPETML